MKSGIAIFSVGIVGVAAAAAVVAPSSSGHVSSTVRGSARPASQSAIESPESRLPQAAPVPGGMVSHSISPAPVTIRSSMPAPPIVAIPRIPGPADMMVAAGREGELKTIRSFASNEACDQALATVRRTVSNAFCVSTTPPPPPPEYGFLVEVDTAKNEIVDLKTYPSMAECERMLAARSVRLGHQAACTSKLH